MRKFGTDKPDLMEFQIGDSDKIYSIPYPASLPAPLLIEMSELEGNDVDAFKFQYKILKMYIGDIVDTLTSKDIAEIIGEWYKGAEEQGAEVGES